MQSPKNSKLKFIIFDIDGTLTNTKNVDDKCFIKAFEKIFDINIENQNWNELKNVTDWGITEEIVQKNLNRKPTEQEFEGMLNEFIGLLKFEKEKDISQFNEIYEAKNFFHYLKNKTEYKIGIATGAWEKSALLKLETIGIDVNGIAFSNSNKYKSREIITKDVINQLSDKFSKPDEIIYFGDGEWDFKTCQKLGIRFIGIDTNNNGKLKKLGVKNVFDNYIEKENILKEIERLHRTISISNNG